MRARKATRRIEGIGIGLRTAACMAAGIVALTASVPAVDMTFNVNEGDWNQAANWNPQQIPGAADKAIVNGGRKVQVTGNQSATEVNLCNAGGQTAFLDMSTGSLTVSGNYYVGLYGSASVLQTGGAVTSATMRVGAGTVGYGHYTQQDGSVRATSVLMLNDGSSSGTGVYHLVNGTLTTPEVRMGNGTGRAEFHQDSGFVTGTTLNMGFSSGNSNVFIQDNGTNTFTGDTRIGRNTAQYSLYEIANGSLAMNGTVYVADSGTSSTGILRQAGGSIAIPGTIRVAPRGQGSVEQNGGTFQAGTLILGGDGGNNAGAVGTLTQSAGTLTASQLWMCDSTAAITSRYVMAGGSLIGGEFRMGNRGGLHDSRVFLSGGNMNVNNLHMGYSNGGNVTAFTQSGGTTVVRNDLLLPRNTPAWAWYEQSGGALVVSNNLTVGTSPAGAGTFHVVGNEADIRVKTYNQNAQGTLKASLSSQGLSPIRVSGTATLGGTLDLGLNGKVFFEPGMVVTVMTYSARSGVFAATSLQEGFSCRVNYLASPANAITLDLLRPTIPGTVVVVR